MWQVFEMLDRLQRGLALGHYSMPQFPELPDDFPLRIAVSAVRRPTECLPPEGRLKVRLGVGAGDTPERAILTALAEAAERYSIQYRRELPEVIPAFRSSRQSPAFADVSEISIGHPGASKKRTSVGAAAGETIEDATCRAALELLEHHHLDLLESGKQPLAAIDPSSIPSTARFAAYLGQRWRSLHLYGISDDLPYAFVYAVTSDFNSGRPTTGSAADVDLEKAARRASEEAIVSWRNMIEIERLGRSMGDLTAEEEHRVALYRGAIPFAPVRLQDCPTHGQTVVGSEARDYLAVLRDVLRRDVAAFDLTVPELGVPVVRVCQL